MFKTGYVNKQVSNRRFVQRFFMNDSSLKRSGMARVKEGSHSFTCHPHIREWNMSHTSFTTRPQSITALWMILISRPAEGRRLSWQLTCVTWRNTDVVCPPEDGHLSRPGIELETSDVWGTGACSPVFKIGGF